MCPFLHNAEYWHWVFWKWVVNIFRYQIITRSFWNDWEVSRNIVQWQFNATKSQKATLSNALNYSVPFWLSVKMKKMYADNNGSSLWTFQPCTLAKNLSCSLFREALGANKFWVMGRIKGVSQILKLNLKGNGKYWKYKLPNKGKVVKEGKCWKWQIIQEDKYWE